MVKKSITLPKELVDEILKYSKKQKRSFSAQMALWAEQKLEESKTIAN
ncbi:MAG: hypothetical protein AAFY16_08045 [Cyanobacteria bacterium J06642_3]